MAVTTVTVMVLLAVGQGASSAWREGRPRMVVNYMAGEQGDLRAFLGNQTHSDHFKLLRQDGSSLLIGARNVVYNLSLPMLEENLDERVEWDSKERDTELCLVKGKSEDECQNYIRVLANTDDGQLLVCGTNSYNPRCRYYLRSESTGEMNVTREFSGKGYCPYDPRHNSTSIFADGELYSGTVSDFSGTDALVIKNQIRTEQYNYKHLNGPDFVNSVEDEDFVYFFFREEAVEAMNCGKSVYSRVARVCKNDRGGPHTFRNKWTTFLKTRLNCSVPGNYPFYFDEVQSMSNIVATREGDMVFGIFNTPDNSIPGSAVCSFRMSEIQESFEGAFKAQNHVNANWLPLDDRDLPKHRPGRCHNDSRSLDEEHLNFLKENMLMDKAVPSSIHLPHYIKTSPHERLTAIAVDPSVAAAGGETADLLFVGTTRGRVLKLASHRGKTHLVEELQVFPLHVAVNNLLVAKEEEGKKSRLVVLSDHEVKSVPVARCHSANLRSCAECVALQDPSCAWDIRNNKCLLHSGSHSDASGLLQNLAEGFHAGCGGAAGSARQGLSSSLSNDLNMEVNHQGEFYSLRTVMSREYSEQTLSLACISSALLSLLVGFLAGYCFFKRCHPAGSDKMNCGHAYLEAQMLERQATKAMVESDMAYDPPYTTPAALATTKNNLLSNQPVVSKDTMKTNLTVTNTGGTLGKCKKVYL